MILLRSRCFALILVAFWMLCGGSSVFAQTRSTTESKTDTDRLGRAAARCQQSTVVRIFVDHESIRGRELLAERPRSLD